MIRASFCCNDSYGHPTGRVEFIDLEDARGFHVQLEGDSRFGGDWPTPRLKFSRRFFAIEPGSWRPRYGTLYWTAARMSQAEAKRLVAYAIERGWQVLEWTHGGPFAAIVKAAAKESSR